LVQTAGRAARHEKGRVLLYADRMNDSLRKTLEVTRNRRERQIQYNEEHGITPRSVRRAVQSSLYHGKPAEEEPIAVLEASGEEEVKQVIAELESEMLQAAQNLEFEKAALIRDQISTLKGQGSPIAYKQQGRKGRKRYRGGNRNA